MQASPPPRTLVTEKRFFCRARFNDAASMFAAYAEYRGSATHAIPQRQVQQARAATRSAEAAIAAAAATHGVCASGVVSGEEEGQGETEEEYYAVPSGIDSDDGNMPVLIEERGKKPKLRLPHPAVAASGSGTAGRVAASFLMSEDNLTALNRPQPQPRSASAVYLKLQPMGLATELVQHLVSDLLAKRTRRSLHEAGRVMGLYLFTFPRQYIRGETDLPAFRLLLKFCKSTPDLRYSDLHCEFLKKSWGYPTFLVRHPNHPSSISPLQQHDILMELAWIYCARREPETFLEFEKRKWEDNPRGLESRGGTAYAAAALCHHTAGVLSHGPAHRSEAAAHALVNAVDFACDTRVGLPRIIVRLLAHYFANDSYETFSFLQGAVEDLLAITPNACDLLELKLLLLQRKKHWAESAMTDLMACADHDDCDPLEGRLKRIADASLAYADFARGEPDALSVMSHSLLWLPLFNQLRCLFLILRSNWRCGTAWCAAAKVLLQVPPRLGPTSPPHLKTFLRKALGKVDMRRFRDTLFDHKRSLVNSLCPSDRIFILLLAPLFLDSSYEALTSLARLISTGLPSGMPSLLCEEGGVAVTAEGRSSVALRMTEGFKMLVSALCYPAGSLVFNESVLVNLVEIGRLMHQGVGGTKEPEKD